MKVWFCWTRSSTTWACWSGSSSVCRSETPARPSPPSQPIRTLPWAHCSSAPHFRLSHVDLGDGRLDSDGEHFYSCFHFGRVFCESISVCLLSQRWLEPEKPLKKQIKGIWISKIHVFFEKYICKSNLPGNIFQFIMIKLWKNMVSSRKMNRTCILGRFGFSLLCELQSTILHLGSQFSAARTDEVCVCAYLLWVG